MTVTTLLGLSNIINAFAVIVLAYRIRRVEKQIEKGKPSL